MIKRRDTVAIESVGEYLLQANEELLQEKKLIDDNIKSIRNNYRGEDADVIILKFLEATSKIKLISTIINYYAQYMTTMSKHDRNNIDYASNQIKTMIDNPIVVKKTDILNDYEIDEEEE